MPQRRGSRIDRLVDILTPLLGFAGIIHETLIRNFDRPYLLTVFVAMIGIRGLKRADRERELAEAVEQSRVAKALKVLIGDDDPAPAEPNASSDSPTAGGSRSRGRRRPSS